MELLAATELPVPRPVVVAGLIICVVAFAVVVLWHPRRAHVRRAKNLPQDRSRALEGAESTPEPPGLPEDQPIPDPSTVAEVGSVADAPVAVDDPVAAKAAEVSPTLGEAGPVPLVSEGQDSAPPVEPAAASASLLPPPFTGEMPPLPAVEAPSTRVVEPPTVPTTEPVPSPARSDVHTAITRSRPRSLFAAATGSHAFGTATGYVDRAVVHGATSELVAPETVAVQRPLLALPAPATRVELPAEMPAAKADPNPEPSVQVDEPLIQPEPDAVAEGTGSRGTAPKPPEDAPGDFENSEEVAVPTRRELRRLRKEAKAAARAAAAEEKAAAKTAAAEEKAAAKEQQIAEKVAAAEIKALEAAARKNRRAPAEEQEALTAPAPATPGVDEVTGDGATEPGDTSSDERTEPGEFTYVQMGDTPFPPNDIPAADDEATPRERRRQAREQRRLLRNSERDARAAARRQAKASAHRADAVDAAPDGSGPDEAADVSAQPHEAPAVAPPVVPTPADADTEAQPWANTAAEVPDAALPGAGFDQDSLDPEGDTSTGDGSAPAETNSAGLSRKEQRSARREEQLAKRRAERDARAAQRRHAKAEAHRKRHTEADGTGTDGTDTDGADTGDTAEGAAVSETDSVAVDVVLPAAPEVPGAAADLDAWAQDLTEAAIDTGGPTTPSLPPGSTVTAGPQVDARTLRRQQADAARREKMLSKAAVAAEREAARAAKRMEKAAAAEAKAAEKARRDERKKANTQMAKANKVGRKAKGTTPPSAAPEAADAAPSTAGDDGVPPSGEGPFPWANTPGAVEAEGPATPGLPPGMSAADPSTRTVVDEERHQKMLSKAAVAAEREAARAAKRMEKAAATEAKAAEKARRDERKKANTQLAKAKGARRGAPVPFEAQVSDQVDGSVPAPVEEKVDWESFGIPEAIPSRQPRG